MNKPLVIDASVAIKWFIREKGTDEALNLLDRLSSFYVPDLFLIEIDSIITKKVRKRELEIADSFRKRRVFRLLPYKMIPYHEVEEFAFRLATEFSITLYDASYLAVAIDYDTKLYTADIRLCNAMSGTPFEMHVERILY